MEFPYSCQFGESSFNFVVFTGHTHLLLPFYLKYIKKGAMDLNWIENEVEDVTLTHSFNEMTQW